MGTPYTTNYGEAFKENFYAILDNDEDIVFKQPTSGPRHLVYPVEQVETNLEYINNPDYFTFLRVMIGINHTPIPYNDLEVGYIDVKYSPVFDEETVSTYSPERDLFSINEVIIKDYVDSANSVIPTDSLMEGYRLLKDEDQ